MAQPKPTSGHQVAVTPTNTGGHVVQVNHPSKPTDGGHTVMVPPPSVGSSSPQLSVSPNADGTHTVNMAHSDKPNSGQNYTVNHAKPTSGAPSLAAPVTSSSSLSPSGGALSGAGSSLGGGSSLNPGTGFGALAGK